MKALLSLAAIFVGASSLSAGILSNYSSANFSTYYIPSVSEASGVTYNRDSGTLFVVDDEGTALTQISKTGAYIDHMTFQHNVPRADRALDDGEGVTYLGNGMFMVADERDMAGRVTSYQAGATRTLADLTPTSYSFGPFAGNSGLEGIAYDPVTNSIWGVKENAPTAVYNMTGIPELTGTPGSSVNLTEPWLGRPMNRFLDNNGVTQLSDIYITAASAAYADSLSILLLARDQKMIFELNREGLLIGSLDISSFGRSTIEGITMDDFGNIYLVSEENPNLPGDAGMSGLHVIAAVPEPSTYALIAIAAVGGFLLHRRRNKVAT